MYTVIGKFGKEQEVNKGRRSVCYSSGALCTTAKGASKQISAKTGTVNLTQGRLLIFLLAGILNIRPTYSISLNTSGHFKLYHIALTYLKEKLFFTNKVSYKENIVCNICF